MTSIFKDATSMWIRSSRINMALFSVCVNSKNGWLGWKVCVGWMGWIGWMRWIGWLDQGLEGVDIGVDFWKRVFLDGWLGFWDGWPLGKSGCCRLFVYWFSIFIKPLICVLRLCKPYSCLRPYHGEITGSRLISKVKHRRAWVVLGWVTTWEVRVL